MEGIGRYIIKKQIRADRSHVYFSAVFEDEQFLIKTFLKEHVDEEGRAQLAHEFYLLKQLNEIAPHFPKVVDFVDDKKFPALVVRDEEFLPLSFQFSRKKVDLNTFFPIAIKLAKIIGEMHSANIIHKNLTPDKIFYNPDTGDVQVADFSIATELRRTMVPPDPPKLLQGSLEYIAPEQTGRMNRPLTPRADLYSLGIIFYELLTGSVPFLAKEPMSIIFGHIAKTPVPPHELRYDIPVNLSLIVMKLLSKMAEDRYKSTSGLVKDLEKVWYAYREGKILESFVPGERDISTILELPEKLYGREAESGALNTAFDQLIETGESALVKIDGYSGIGKTSLVNELTKKITLAEGLFTGGSFSMLQQSDAYEGLRKALDRLVHYILSMPEKEYEQFKENLFREVGAVLPVIVEFIPRLKSVVGDLPHLPETGIQETLRRFELAMQRFIKVVTDLHPLVLFLDDMQWAKESMYDLLLKLMLRSDIKNFLVIIAYRSNAVGQNHPLHEFLSNIEPKRAVHSIHLEGLKEEHLSALLQDMLYLPKEEVSSLANLLEKKTEGNPFFLLMSLEELYSDNLLKFSTEKNKWTWDEATIAAMPAMENVVEVVNRRLIKLPKETQDLLHLASCTGSIFNLEDLNIVKKIDLEELVKALEPAIKDGLIIPIKMSSEWLKGVSKQKLASNKWRFQHDKIMQSCYELKPKEESVQRHLDLARNWYAANKDNLSNRLILAITDQYNRGLKNVTEDEEKMLICQLNYKAGRIAMKSTAHDAAYRYDKTAKDLFIPEVWDNDYQFAFEVYLGFIESSFMTHRYIESKSIGEELFSLANNNYDKARIMYLRGELERAIATGEEITRFFEEGLSLLGYEEVSKKPSILEVLKAIIRFNWRVKHSYAPLDSLNDEVDEKLDMSFLFVARLGEECYYKGDPLRYIYSLTTWCVATYFQQNKILRAITYGIKGMTDPRSDFTYRITKESQKVLKNAPNTLQTSTPLFVLITLHDSWRRPWKELSEEYQVAAKNCEEVGNFEYVAQSYLNQILFNTKLGCRKALENFETSKSHIEEISPRARLLSQIFSQYYRNLIGECPINTWTDVNFDEAQVVDEANRMHYQIAINRLTISKFQLAVHCLNGRISEDEKRKLSSYLHAIIRSNHARDSLLGCFYLFMTEAQHIKEKSFFQRVKTEVRLFKLYRKIGSWVKYCPANFEFAHIMMQAEFQRWRGKFNNSINLYVKAVRLARRHEVLEFQALACKRAFQLCLVYHDNERAKRYYDMAIEAYENWEAYAVVDALKQEYGFYFAEKEDELKGEEPTTVKDAREYGLDARSVILAAEVLGKEIHLEGLLKNILELLSENVGATKSALCLLQKEKLWVEGYFDSTVNIIQTLPHIYWKDANLSHDIMRQTMREKKEVMVLDTSRSSFNLEQYVEGSGAKCVISVPIFKGENIIGIIYCENNVTTNAFTEERLDILRALSIQMSISVENSRLYTTFEKFVPKPFLKEIGVKYIFDIEQGDSVEKEMNVLFADIRNFTDFAEKHSANESFRFINDYLARVTPVIHARGGFVDKFLGDGVMAFFPTDSDESLRACIEMQQKVAELSKEMEGEFSVNVGMGMHHGPLMLGIVGEARHIEGTVIGDTVNVASRLEALNKIYGTQCLISDTVKDTLKHPEDFQFRKIGTVKLLGREESVSVWQVLDVIVDKAERDPFIETIQIFEEGYQYYLNREFDEAMMNFKKVLHENPRDTVAQFYLNACHNFMQEAPPSTWNGEVEMKVK